MFQDIYSDSSNPLVKFQEKFLILGNFGRFATSFRKEIPPSNLIASYSFRDFMNDSTISRIETSLKRCNVVVWTFGSGQMNDPIQSEEFVGLQRLKQRLSVAKTKSIHFIYLSSAGALYRPSFLTQDEASLPQPRTTYGYHKLKCEEFVIRSIYPLVTGVTIFRIANAYSIPTYDRQPKGLVEIATHSGINSRPLPVWVDLNSRKQYGSHSNYAQNMLRILESLKRWKSKDVRVVNIAPPFSYSVREIIEILELSLKRNISLTLSKEPLWDGLLINSSLVELNELPWNSLEDCFPIEHSGF